MKGKRVQCSTGTVHIALGALLGCMLVLSSPTVQAQNLLANPSFEADGTSTENPQGWTKWTGANEAGAVYTQDTAAVTGSYELSFYDATAYQASMYQSFQGLPVGNYDLKAFVQSGGGQTAAYIFASGCSGTSSYVDTPIPTTNSTSGAWLDGEWNEVELANIQVTAGTTCEVGIYTNANAGEWLNADDFRFVEMPANLASNPGFETGNLTGWTSSGSNPGASYVQSGGYSGSYELSNYSASAYQVLTSQTLTNLTNGYYSLSAMVQNSGGQTAAVIQSTNCGGPNKAVSLPVTTWFGSSTWTKIELRGIHVTNGQCTIGILSNANAGNWINVDNVQFMADGIQYNIIVGGESTMTADVQANGGTYYLNGVAEDPYTIMGSNGMNVARLEVYNDPGNANYSPADDMLSYWNLANTLALAKRAQAAGMTIELTLHFSDYWTNPQCQYLPHAWVGLSQSALVTALSQYVTSVVQQMVAQGTTPTYVAIGNEADNGILFQVGPLQSNGSCGGSIPAANGSFQYPSNLAQLYTAAYNAVKAAAPNALVMWHLGGYTTPFLNVKSYLDQMSNLGAPVDIIALSAYPAWTDESLAQLQELANFTIARYGKPVLWEESAYPWTAAVGCDEMTNGGTEPYALTESGQLAYIYDLINTAENADNGQLLGFEWWGTDWIPNNLGTCVDNYTLFDRSGNALPGLIQGYGNTH